MGITREFLDVTPDDQIESAIIQALIDIVTGTADEAYDKVMTLTPGLRMMWGTFMADGEVFNGGFNQFFWNDSRQYATQAIEGFRLIGAEEHARLVEDGVQLFFAEADKLRPFRQRRTLDAFSESYEHTDSSGLDTRYYALPDFSPLRVRYIREHPQEFLLDDTG
jgi:hypothetical protein